MKVLTVGLTIVLALVALLIALVASRAWTEGDYVAFVLWFACMILVALPPKYDPAVRLKEWMIEKGRRS